MLSRSSEIRYPVRRAMRVAMTIMDLPVMALIGYVIGRRAGMEFEGTLVGLVLGLVLMIITIWPEIKYKI